MSRLRVAIDARPLQDQPLGGVGRYLACLVPHLADEVDVTLLLDARRGAPRRDLGPAVELAMLSAPLALPALGWLEVAVAPWLRGFDGILHGAFNVLPMTFRGTSVLTLHDLAPQRHPEDFSRPRRHAWRLYIRRSVRKATLLTTVSEFAKHEIVDHFGVDAQAVLVARDVLDSSFGPHLAADAPSIAGALGIEGPYVVAVGGASRRGLAEAIDAWRRVRQDVEPCLSLAVAGEARLPTEPGLVPLGRIDDDSWATLLAGARGLCYPTRYEGFGLPALEAAASGTPVLCAPVASLPEVLGDAACWCQEPSGAAMAPVLARLLTDKAWYEERRQAGLRRAAEAPSAGTVAGVLVRAYEQAAQATKRSAP